MMTFTTRAAGNSVAYNWLAVARHYHGIFDLRKWLPHRSNAQRFIVIHILRRDAEAFVKNARDLRYGSMALKKRVSLFGVVLFR
jgi:hypothetical protein